MNERGALGNAQSGDSASSDGVPLRAEKTQREAKRTPSIGAFATPQKHA